MTARIFMFLTVVLVFVAPARGQEREVPYWATIRASELNLRVGPSADYKVAWVYRRPGLPVKVIRVMEGWRLIEDHEGTQGWVVARLLSPEQGAVVVGKALADMRSDPAPNAALKWRLETGVVGKLGECDRGWCEFQVDRYRGWVRQNRLWGAGQL